MRPAVSNEHVATYGTPTAMAAFGRGPHLFGRRHRLDPRDVGAAGDERLDLLGERLERVGLGELAERLEERARRSDRAGDHHRALGGLGHLAGELGGALRELADPGLGAVEREPVAVAAEGVGQDDVGARVDEPAVQVLDPVGVVDVPELGRLARRRGPSRSSWCRWRRRRAAHPWWRGARRDRRACRDRSAAAPGRGATFPRFRGGRHQMTDDVLDELFSIRGKTAVITGGTRGIGLMMAEAYVRAGVKVYVSSRKADVVRRGRRPRCREIGECIGIPADLSTEAECRRLADEIASREDRLHILINNAGRHLGRAARRPRRRRVGPGAEHQREGPVPPHAVPAAAARRRRHRRRPGTGDQRRLDRRHPGPDDGDLLVLDGQGRRAPADPPPAPGTSRRGSRSTRSRRGRSSRR